MIPLNLSEDQEQTSVVNWLERKGYCVFAVPNGGKRALRTAVNLKRTGTRRGAPDLVLISRAPANGEPTIIEMKKKKGATYSPEQLALHEIARAERWNVIAPPKGFAAAWVIQQLQALGY